MCKTALFILFAAGALPGFLLAQAQQPVEVCDLTLRLKSNDVQELFYGFAAGDQIVFSFSELDGRALDAVEIAEYPEQIRYRDMQTAAIQDKVVYAQAAAVYRFTFRNDRGEKTCKVRILRIPASEKTRAFRTNVRWVEQYDTTYLNKPATVENRLIQRSRKILDRVDTAVVNLIDKKERVHSRSNFYQESSSTVKVKLPANYQEADRTYEVLSWVYWIGVGEDGEGKYQEANRAVKLAKSLSGAAKSFSLISGPYGALAALAIDGVSFFLPPGKGDNILYQVQCGGKAIDQGNGPAAYARHTSCTQGEIAFRLENDNLVDAVDVSLRVMAVAIIKIYREETYYEQQAQPVAETRITVKKVPVLSN